MATGAAASQGIYIDGGDVKSLSWLYGEYMKGTLANHTIHYVDPNDPKTVLGQHVDTVINEKVRMGVRLTTEDGATVVVSAAGFVVDAAEDEPCRMTLRLPSDAKCLVGPNGFNSGKLLVRKIIRREFVTTTIMTLPMPNMIAASNFIIVC